MDREADRYRARRRSRFFLEIGPVLAEHITQLTRLNIADDKGETRRQRNERFGIETAEPDPLPPDLQYLLEWFWDIGSARSQGMIGPNPLALSDILAWSSLTGTIMRREEVGIIRDMDAAYLDTISKEQAERRRSEPPRKKE